jgi:hypothetical protein
MLLEIRKLSVESIDLDEAVAALAMTKSISAEYNVQGVPAPEWLTERIGELDREVKSRKRDYLQRALKAAQARQATLKTREEKAAETQAEIDRLNKLLAQ